MQDQLSVRQIHDILSGWLSRTAHNIQAFGDNFPDYHDPKRGEWALNGGWTEGFWTGILWWLYVHSKDGRFETWARKYTRLLAEQKSNFSDHDLGFLFYHSCVLENLITGDEKMVPAALSAARRLANRFNPRGCFIRAHGTLSDPQRAGYAIIDTIMNLRLLFWAHMLTENSDLFDIGYETARTISREYVREDGSSYQVVWFDPDSGAVKKKGTLQGYDANSCWSRGQAWGIYGFTQTYKFTGEPHFRDQAVSMAQYFLRNLPEDGVASYDFNDPTNPNASKDTSAQAIAAAGLLALANLTIGAERRTYLAQAKRLLVPLCSTYLLERPPDQIDPRGFLKGGCYFLAKDRGVNSELIFGDYYLLEALMRFLSTRLWQ